MPDQSAPNSSSGQPSVSEILADMSGRPLSEFVPEDGYELTEWDDLEDVHKDDW